LLAVVCHHHFTALERDWVPAGLRAEEKVKIAAKHPQSMLRHVMLGPDWHPDGYGEEHSTSGDLCSHHSSIVQDVGLWS